MHVRIAHKQFLPTMHKRAVAVSIENGSKLHAKPEFRFPKCCYGKNSLKGRIIKNIRNIRYNIDKTYLGSGEVINQHSLLKFSL